MLHSWRLGIDPWVDPASFTVHVPDQGRLGREEARVDGGVRVDGTQAALELADRHRPVVDDDLGELGEESVVGGIDHERRFQRLPSAHPGSVPLQTGPLPVLTGWVG